MKRFLKVMLLCVMLVCLGALTVLAADAAVGTEAELTAAINAANSKTASSTPTTITLTGNVSLSANKSIAVEGKHIVIDGQGKYTISRETVTSKSFVFVLKNGADLTLQNVTVDTHSYAVNLATNAGASLTVGAGATITSTIPTDYEDGTTVSGDQPYLIVDAGGNTVTVAAGGQVRFEDVTHTSRSCNIQTKGVLHVYGTLYNGVNCDNRNHRLIHANGTNAEVYVYEGAVLTLTGNGGAYNGTALIWTNGNTTVINGGTFSAPNWKNDTSTGTGNTGSPRAMFYMSCGDNAVFTVKGGNFSATACADSYLFAVNCNMTVNIEGGTFTHSGGDTIVITGNAKLNITGNTQITSGRYLIHSTTCSPVITVKDNALLYASAASGRVMCLEAGKPVVNISGSAHLKAGKTTDSSKTGYNLVYFNRTSGNIGDTDGFVTLNISGNPVLESTYSCIYVETPSVTTTSIYNVLNITGGTFNAETKFGLNLKESTRISITALSGATFNTYNACVNVENVTFKQTALTFSNCVFNSTYPEDYTSTLCAAIRLGFDSNDVFSLTSLTLTNCEFSTKNEIVSVGPKATVSTVYINSTGSEPHTYSGIFLCENTTAATTFVFNGTSDVILRDVTVGGNANTTLKVAGTGALTLQGTFTVNTNVGITVGGTSSITVTAENVTITSTGKVLAVTDTAVVDATFTNCNVTTKYSMFWGKANSKNNKLTVNGGTYKLTGSDDGNYGNSLITPYGAAASFYCTVDLDNAAFTATNGYLVYFQGPNNYATVVMDNCTFSGMSMLHSTGSSKLVDITVNSGEYKATKYIVMMGPGTTVKLAINGGKFVCDGDVMRIGARSGSDITITDGIFESNGAATCNFGNETGADQKPAFNIYGGYFSTKGTFVVRVTAGVTVNIYGGTFQYVGTATTANTLGVVMVGEIRSSTYYGATLNVYGGMYRDMVTSNPIFNTLHDLAKLNVKSCTARGTGSFIINFGSGSPSAAHDNSSEYTTVNGLAMKHGSTMRLVPSTAGLRFVTTLTKSAYDFLKGIADNGELTFGTLIMPAQYMTWANTYAKEYSKKALDALDLQYLDIKSTSQGFHENADGSVTINAAITNVKDANLKLDFAALAYVTYKVNGVTVTQYSNYNATKNVRNIYQVARAAANDVSATEQDKYVYQIAGNGNSAYNGKYSPYSVEQWSIINRYWKWNNTTKSEVKTIDLFLIAGQSNAAGYSPITDSDRSKYGSTTYSNIYYSGQTPGYQVNKITNSKGETKELIKAISHPDQLFHPGTTKVKIGLGRDSTYIGGEFGIAMMLSDYYNSTTGRTAGIVKYAIGATTLTDNLGGANFYNGNWCPDAYRAEHGSKGPDSGKLAHAFVAHVESAVEDYRAMGYTVNIKAMFWMQGETDRLQVANGVIEKYPVMFKQLIEQFRGEFKRLTPYNTNTVDVMVGEVSANFKHKDEDLANITAILKMQRTLDDIPGLPNIYIINSSQFDPGTDDAHWSFGNMLTIGKMVGYAFMTKTLGLTGIKNPAP